MSELLDKMRRRAGRYLAVHTARIRPERGVLSLSFDDIPATAWTEAGPILNEHGVKATYYVCGGLEGGENLGLPQFTTAHLQALFAAGHEVGCHSFSHTNSLKVSATEYAADLDRNAAWVAERLNDQRMTTFAWPYGDVAMTTKALIADRFALGRGIRDGINAGSADRANLQAIGLESRRLPGYDLKALMAETAERRGWLVAYGHDVMDRPSPYGCTPDDLDRVLRLAKTAGLEILPVGAAWARIQ
jgi:peptidoglycan/xylan/chitin deacetylase (PgdA/CDA1 family)